MNATPRPFWPPLVSGIALGLALLLTFLITGHGLAASGLFTELTAAIGKLLVPGIVEANRYLGPYAKGNPLTSWVSWEILGVIIGALAGALSSGRFRFMVERGTGIRPGGRLGWAFLGGILTGFGSRLARGCTSGLGLSGGATLSVAAFLFLVMFFAAGFVTMRFTRRTWE
ncbi:MAG: YeeE/YedE thiosulfate transporter family protein [bacterium]|nr:YeeE/YedE thiosulfate transporter family protein [bacterium]